MIDIRKILVFSACLLTGCNVLPFGPGGDCPTWVKPGIVVVVVNAESGEPEAADAWGWIRSEGYAEDLVPHSSEGIGEESVLLSLQAALGRPGVYDVFVRKDGFEDWDAREVEVKDATCSVDTVELIARLEPVSPSLDI